MPDAPTETPTEEKTFVNGEPVIEAPAEPPASTPETEQANQLDDLERQIATREWTVKGDFKFEDREGAIQTQTFERTYEQKPLSYTAMMQFTSLIADRISEAMAGPDGMTIDGIVSDAQGMVDIAKGTLTRSDFDGVDALVRGLAKIATHVPTVFEDCQCIWLRIPLAERPMVKEIWARSPSEGGLSISDGDEMLSIFLEQNYEEVEDFFAKRLRAQVDRITKLRDRKARREGGSRLSRPSSPTQAATQSP